MANICKFLIPPTYEPFEVRIKGFQEVVHAGHDEAGDAALWAMTNPDMPEEAWTFYVVQDDRSFDSTKWVHLKTFDLTSGAVLHLLRPLQQWGVQPGSSMDDDKPITPSASTTRHMIGDLRKHLRSAFAIAGALEGTFDKLCVKLVAGHLDDADAIIRENMKHCGIAEDSVTMGYEDESH